MIVHQSLHEQKQATSIAHQVGLFSGLSISDRNICHWHQSKTLLKSGSQWKPVENEQGRMPMADQARHMKGFEGFSGRKRASAIRKVERVKGIE